MHPCLPSVVLHTKYAHGIGLGAVVVVACGSMEGSKVVDITSMTNVTLSGPFVGSIVGSMVGSIVVDIPSMTNVTLSDSVVGSIVGSMVGGSGRRTVGKEDLMKGI